MYLHEVADALNATESAAAARTILDTAENLVEWADPMDVAGLAMMMRSLAPQLSKEDALQLTKRIALRFETIPDWNHQKSMLHAFRSSGRDAT